MAHKGDSILVSFKPFVFEKRMDYIFSKMNGGLYKSAKHPQFDPNFTGEIEFNDLILVPSPFPHIKLKVIAITDNWIREKIIK